MNEWRREGKLVLEGVGVGRGRGRVTGYVSHMESVGRVDRGGRIKGGGVLVKRMVMEARRSHVCL